ncbi:MAG: SAM-dependent methyltransferase [Gemmatimonadetes bacterium]|nr:SAM-dependent methyltransferase [Gemmatimonadota bacterium]
MDDYSRANRDRWDELVPIHAKSPFYDVAGFERGRIALDAVEREGVGNVIGKTLLHLQCHFGLSTLSWARLGAEVTGVDFSPRAIDLARKLARKQDLPADFICCDVYDLQHHLDRQFDVVFSSYGVLCWLSDLEPWGRTIARHLAPGGTFFLAEFHPFLWVFDDDPATRSLRLRYPYFKTPKPLRFEEDGTYTGDKLAKIRNTTTYEWSHSFSDVLQALIDAGLKIDEVREFDRCCYQALPIMKEAEKGWWKLPKEVGSLPLMFSIRATHRRGATNLLPRALEESPQKEPEPEEPERYAERQEHHGHAHTEPQDHEKSSGDDRAGVP